MPEVSPLTYRLRDGALVRVRTLRPSDEKLLRVAFDELTPRSRYQRFLGPVSELSDALWRYLCDIDGRDHVAIVALPWDESHIVGCARFVRLSTEPSTAEVAVTIADAWQRRGLGSLLFELLADTACGGGIRDFVAHALPSNVGIRRVMARRGPVQRRAHGLEDTLLLRLRVPTPAPGPRSRTLTPFHSCAWRRLALAAGAAAAIMASWSPFAATAAPRRRRRTLPIP